VVKLTKKDALHLAEQEMPETAFFDAVVPALAKSDRVMAVPAQLFLTGLPHRQVLPLWRQIERTYLAILHHYPASARILDLLHKARDLRTSPWQALEVAAETRYIASLPPVESEKPLKKAEQGKLQHNLLFNVVLWLNQLGSADLPAIVRELHKRRWSSAIGSVRKPVDRLKLLLKLTDHAAAGLTASAFAVEADEQARLAEDAARREGQAASALASSEVRVQALEQQVKHLSSAIEGLKAEFTQAEQEHKSAMTHAENDMDQLRSRVTRRMEAEVDLLQEGLLALRRDPPKTHVMDDHAERAISGLKAEMRSLSEGKNA
jgi:hypothetical protein